MRATSLSLLIAAALGLAPAWALAQEAPIEVPRVAELEDFV